MSAREEADVAREAVYVAQREFYAALPRCYHPAGNGLGCGLHAGHSSIPHNTVIDLSAPVPAAEIAKRAARGMPCPCGCCGCFYLIESEQ